MIAIILLIVFFILVTKTKYKSIATPAFIFNVIWMIAFIFVEMKLSNIYKYEFSSYTKIVFICMIVFFNIFFIIFTTGVKGKRENKKIVLFNLIKAKKKEKFIIKLFYIWLLLIVLEIIYCRGIPLIWKILGLNYTYATFGIPSVHGFINSLSWFIATLAFIEYLDSKNKSYIKILLVINIIYVFLLARQSIITEIIQLTCVYMLKNKIRIKNLLIVALLTIIGFGLIGNIRTDSDFFIARSNLIWKNIPNWSIGFFWVYMYIMTPVVNIAYFFDKFTIFTYGKSSIITFLPTAFVKMLNLEDLDTSNYLISQTFNVSTALLVPFKDFGIFGVIAFSSFLGALGGFLFKRISLNRNDKRMIVNYSVYIGILALTFFSNMLLSFPIVMQFVYINIIFKNYFYLEEENT